MNLRAASFLLLCLGILLSSCGRGDGAESGELSREGHADAMWGSGYFPNVELTAHDGRRLRFFDDMLKGKVVAINFIYTSCPDACPMETARMLEVQRLLGDRLGKDVFFYSISIDPEKDKPEVLAKYAADWGVKEGWTFVTGSREDIDLLRRKFGVYDAELARGKPMDHNLSLIIGNQRTGRWMKRSPYENPYVLANQLGSWLHNWKLPSEEKRPYDEAPEVRNIGAGENLFRTRCSSCHTVGGGETSAPDERRIGPDLYNITRQRDRAWLERWIMAPDQMKAEADPMALALISQYKGVVMPNLRMTQVDVDNVLQYLEEESARLDQELESRSTSAPVPVK
jgi:protein SCO1